MVASTQSIVLTAALFLALLFGALTCFAKAVRVRSSSYSPFRQTDGTAVRGIESLRSKLSSSYGLQGAALLLASALFLGTRNAIFGAAALVVIYAVALVVRRSLARTLLP
jgi:hypothetical protein